MTKLFGAFLIEQKLVPSDLVLDALIQQLRSTPSVAEIVYDNNIMPKRQLLDIIIKQQLSGDQFSVCAKELGLWNDEIAQSVAVVTRKRRRPLGEIILEMGGLTIDSFNTAVDSYISLAAQPAKEQLGSGTSLSTDMSQIQQKLCRRDSVFLNPSLISEYLFVYDHSLSVNLGNILGKLGIASNSTSDFFRLAKSLESEFVGLRAAAKFVGAAIVEEIADNTIFALSVIGNGTNQNLRMPFFEILKSAAYLVGVLTEGIRSLGKEANLEADSMVDNFVSNLRLVNLPREVTAAA